MVIRQNRWSSALGDGLGRPVLVYGAHLELLQIAPVGVRTAGLAGRLVSLIRVRLVSVVSVHLRECQAVALLRRASAPRTLNPTKVLAMRNPRDFGKPLAIGAPAPVLEIPFKPSRMIHFLDFSNEKMVAKVPDIAPTVDILLGNLEDAVPVDRKEAARERPDAGRQGHGAGRDPAVDARQQPRVAVGARRHHDAGDRDRPQARRDDDPEGRGPLGHPLRRSAARPARGARRPRAADPDPRDPRDRPRRRQPRGDRDR